MTSYQNLFRAKKTFLCGKKMQPVWKLKRKVSSLKAVNNTAERTVLELNEDRTIQEDFINLDT